MKLLHLDSVSLSYNRYSRTLVPRIVETVHAVRNVGLTVGRGEIFGIVGESGSGKSSLVRAALLMERPSSGRVFFDGIDLTALTPNELAETRRGMQVVFQNPADSLNPDLSVAEIVAEPLTQLRVGTPAEQQKKVHDVLNRVGINPADAHDSPPHFSGGQQQRIAIARAIVVEPQVLFADEAVSALDVSIAAEIVDLLLDLRTQLGFSIVFVSHDLAVVQNLCDRVAVMKDGSIVEEADTHSLYTFPRHEYTKTLLQAARHTEIV